MGSVVNPDAVDNIEILEYFDELARTRLGSVGAPESGR
jgi:hypothetical protein